jgi:hypothetical protein
VTDTIFSHSKLICLLGFKKVTDTILSHSKLICLLGFKKVTDTILLGVGSAAARSAAG